MPVNVTADPQRFDEAIEDLRKRVPMTKAEWEELEQRARARAFTVAGIAQLDVLNDTKKSLVDALEHGQTLEEWKKEAGERLESEWQGSVANPAARLETIYRTNLQTAYSRGHEIQASHPAVQRYRPYKRFLATLDTDTTDVCREAHGTVLPADHSWWNDHTPPLHFNCRSTVETLSEEEALRLGITESPTSLKAAEGFGAKPEVDPDPTLEKWAAEKLEQVDAELAEIYRAKEAARETEEPDIEAEPGRQSGPEQAGKDAPPSNERRAGPDPEHQLKLGDHVKWAPPGNLSPDEHAEVLSSIKSKEVLSFLEQNKINAIEFPREHELQGTFGSTDHTTGRIVVQAQRPAGSWGNTPSPSLKAVSWAGQSALDAVKLTYAHEVAHHIRKHGPPELRQLLNDVFGRKAAGGGDFVSARAEVSPSEYFSECFAAYFDPALRQYLKDTDPEGYKLVRQALKLVGR